MELFRKKKDLSSFDKKRIAVSELEIILTKKCNLSCAHCMRGNTTNKEISLETLDAIFERIQYIDNLSLGGGEPSLAPYTIRALTKALKNHNVIVPHVNFTTNGISVSDEFIDALLELKIYIEESSRNGAYFESPPITACFSFDDFHLEQILKIYGKEGLNILYQNVAKYQNALSEKAIVCRLSCDIDIFDSGRAKNLNPREHQKVPMILPKDTFFPYIESNKSIFIGGIIAISTDGEVLPPNIPFDAEKTLSYGNIRREPLSTIFGRAKTKKCSDLNFDFQHNRAISKNFASKKVWKNYLAEYGEQKLNLFYAKVGEFAEKQSK